MGIFEKLGKLAALWIALAVVAMVVVTGVVINISVTNTGNKTEAALNSQYVDNQNVLSDCLVQIQETANITSEQSEQFQQAMQDAVMGRYDTSSGAMPAEDAMFAAIVESYPDLSSLSEAYERVHTTAVGCRSDYRDIQSKLLDMLGQYDAWRTGSWTVRTFAGDEFPSNNLVARIGDTRSYGQEALDQMWTIVLVSEAAEATESGTLEPLDPFADPSESPSGE